MSAANILNSPITGAPAITGAYAGSGGGSGSVIAGSNISITPSILGNAINVAVTTDLNMGNNDIISIDNLKLLDSTSLLDATVNFDGTNVVIDTPIKPTTIADSAASTGTINQLLASTGSGGLVWVNGGGGGVGVNSVTGGTNISTTGTTTNPIVNLAISSDINMGASFSVNNINNAMFRHLPSFNTATISFDATNLTTDKPLKPDGICDNNNVTGGAGQVLTSDGAGNIVWAAGGGGSGITSVNSATGPNITIAGGTNVTVGTVGNTITVSSTGGSGGPILIDRNDYLTYTIPPSTTNAEQLTLFSSVGLPAGAPQYSSLPGNPTFSSTTFTNYETTSFAREFGTDILWVGGVYSAPTTVPVGFEITGWVSSFNLVTQTWSSTVYEATNTNYGPGYSPTAIINQLTIDPLGNKLYVGGYFVVFDGLTANNLAVIDLTTGNASALIGPSSENGVTASSTSIVYDMAYVNPTGLAADVKIVIAGAFLGTDTLTVQANNIITWEPATTEFKALTPSITALNGMNNYVNSVAYGLNSNDNIIVLGGAFTQQNGGSGAGGQDIQYLCSYDFSTQTYAAVWDSTGTTTPTGPTPRIVTLYVENSAVLMVTFYDMTYTPTLGTANADIVRINNVLQPTQNVFGWGTTFFPFGVGAAISLINIPSTTTNDYFIIVGQGYGSPPFTPVFYRFSDITGGTPTLVDETSSLLPTGTPAEFSGAIYMIEDNDIVYIPVLYTPSPAGTYGSSSVSTYAAFSTSGPNVFAPGIFWYDGTIKTSFTLSLYQSLTLMGIGTKWLVSAKNF